MQKLAIISAAYAPVTSRERKFAFRVGECVSGCARYTRCIIRPGAVSLTPRQFAHLSRKRYPSSDCSVSTTVSTILPVRFSFLSPSLCSHTRKHRRLLEIGTADIDRSMFHHCVVSTFLFFFRISQRRRYFRLNFSVSSWWLSTSSFAFPLFLSLYASPWKSYFPIARSFRWFFSKFEVNFRSNSEGNFMQSLFDEILQQCDIYYIIIKSTESVTKVNSCFKHVDFDNLSFCQGLFNRS